VYGQLIALYFQIMILNLNSAEEITEELTSTYPNTPGSQRGKQIYFKACTFSRLPTEPSGKSKNGPPPELELALYKIDLLSQLQKILMSDKAAQYAISFSLNLYKKALEWQNTELCRNDIENIVERKMSS
jgi:hypothetical protein